MATDHGSSWESGSPGSAPPATVTRWAACGSPDSPSATACSTASASASSTTRWTWRPSATSASTRSRPRTEKPASRNQATVAEPMAPAAPVITTLASGWGDDVIGAVSITSWSRACERIQAAASPSMRRSSGRIALQHRAVRLGDPAVPGPTEDRPGSVTDRAIDHASTVSIARRSQPPSMTAWAARRTAGPSRTPCRRPPAPRPRGRRPASRAPASSPARRCPAGHRAGCR